MNGDGRGASLTLRLTFQIGFDDENTKRRDFISTRPRVQMGPVGTDLHSLLCAAGFDGNLK